MKCLKCDRGYLYDSVLDGEVHCSHTRCSERYGKAKLANHEVQKQAIEREQQLKKP